MAEIVPAILETTLPAFEKKAGEMIKLPYVKRIQIDVSDGSFTNTKTVGLDEIEILNPIYVWEAHLMVYNPETYFLDAKIAGFRAVAIHFEAVEKEHIAGLAKTLRGYSMSPVLALNPETSIEEARSYLNDFDTVLLLGVNPGLQGEPFIESTYEKVRRLRAFYKGVIEVDGGVSMGNARRLAESGADLLVVGSALRHESDKYTATQNFERLTSEVLRV